MLESTLLIRGIISTLPDGDKKTIQECYDELKAVLDKYGEIGTLALALLGSETSDTE